MLGNLGITLNATNTRTCSEEHRRRDGDRDAAAVRTSGEAIDVTGSSLGNAKSLRGGTLLMAPLKGADGQVYAMAQGNLVVGGAGASATAARCR